MKKSALTLAILTMLSGWTASAQGWIDFTANRYTANNFFTTPGVLDTTYGGMDVALYIAITPTNSFTGAPLVESLENGVSTNSATAGQGIDWNLSQAWNDINTDPNFQLATDVTADSSVIMGVTTGNHGGGWQYADGTADNVEINTDAGIMAGNAYEMYVVGWNSAYANPAAAAAAGSAVGWSQKFVYKTYAAAGDMIPPTTPSQFGIVMIDSFPGPAPEPAALALAGLGGVVLLAFRRKKA